MVWKKQKWTIQQISADSDLSWPWTLLRQLSSRLEAWRGSLRRQGWPSRGLDRPSSTGELSVPAGRISWGHMIHFSTFCFYNIFNTFVLESNSSLILVSFLRTNWSKKRNYLLFFIRQYFVQILPCRKKLILVMFLIIIINLMWKNDFFKYWLVFLACWLIILTCSV